MFRNVCVQLGPFRYGTKLGAKWAELLQLMQKLMPRSRVGTIHYKRTRNTPWDRFATALNSVQMGQSGAINAKVRATKSRLNLSLRTHLIHTIGP